MKRMATLFLSPVLVGIALALFGLSGIRREGFWEWCLAAAFLAVGLLIGAVLNLALFAPAYWLLGRLYRRRFQAEARREHES